MKKALVTGGTRGIGLAIVAMLLQEEYHVVSTYACDEIAAKNSLQYLAKQGIPESHIKERLQLCKANQGSATDRQQLVRLLYTGSKIDCLVLNAGTTLRKSLSETTDEEWKEVMDINLNSNAFLIRDLLPIIPSNSRIVFIGSLMAQHTHATSLVYGVSKGALHALAKNLVKVFANTGTTVNVVAPGFVETDWQREKPQNIRDNITAKTAVARFAEVNEIADAVRFCLNNAFVNGATIEVNGGYDYQ